MIEDLLVKFLFKKLLCEAGAMTQMVEHLRLQVQTPVLPEKKKCGAWDELNDRALGSRVNPQHHKNE
jgi:hypothetical protein